MKICEFLRALFAIKFFASPPSRAPELKCNVAQISIYRPAASLLAPAARFLH